MSVDAARARIEPWLAPISDAVPAGEDARYEPLHEGIRNEAAKLDSPTTGLPNWAQLVKDAQALTTQKSKDLLIESYAAYGLYDTEGLLGLSSGLFLLAESMDRFWEGMHPPAKRLRARVNAINWLTERLDTTLPVVQVGAGDHEAIAALDAAVKRLRSVVAERFEDQAPALRPLSETVERLKMSLPERADGGGGDGPDTEPPPPAEAAPSAPSAMPAPIAAPAAVAPAPVAAPAAAPVAAPEAPKAETAEELVAEIAAQASEYTQPVPGDAPAGIDAKYELDHEELRGDIAALDTPTGGNLDWNKVAPRAGRILKDKSKDLLIASYLGWALWETKKLEGLAIGLEVITQICEKYWEDCQPPVRRVRGRANALTWMLDKLEEPLPQAPLKAEDRRAVDQLDAVVTRFANVVRDKFEDAAPSLRPLQNNVQRLKMSVPEPAAAAPPPPPPTAAAPAAPRPQAAPAARPAAPSAPPAAVALGGAPAAALADPKEVGKFATSIQKSLLDAAKALREAAPQDPTSYQFVRLALALGTSLPPAEGGSTKVPPPQDMVVKDFETKLGNQSWEALVKAAEIALPAKRYWLDLNRYAALGLANLGAPYTAAKDAVIAGTAYWVKQYPELLDMSFAGGLPFASAMTKEWIQSEVMPSGGGGGGGDASEGSEVLAAARALAAGGKVEEALSTLVALAQGGHSGRARFKAKLAMAQALGGATAAAAEGIYDGLLREIDAVDLERWEPELAADCYRGQLACLRQMKKPNDPALSEKTAEVFRRLCRVDPLAAVKTAS